MSLNKRKCRAFADPGFKMRSHSGILHAPQIDHIIRTAIKIIDHHKTLLLYIYPSQQAAQGDSSPLWVVFQKKDDYATLERQEDGSFKWRTAAFERLGDSWDFIKRCTFYSKCYPGTPQGQAPAYAGKEDHRPHGQCASSAPWPEKLDT